MERRVTIVAAAAVALAGVGAQGSGAVLASPPPTPPDPVPTTPPSAPAAPDAVATTAPSAPAPTQPVEGVDFVVTGTASQTEPSGPIRATAVSPVSGRSATAAAAQRRYYASREYKWTVNYIITHVDVFRQRARTDIYVDDSSIRSLNAYTNSCEKIGATTIANYVRKNYGTGAVGSGVKSSWSDHQCTFGVGINISGVGLFIEKDSHMRFNWNAKGTAAPTYSFSHSGY